MKYLYAIFIVLALSSNVFSQGQVRVRRDTAANIEARTGTNQVGVIMYDTTNDLLRAYNAGGSVWDKLYGVPIADTTAFIKGSADATKLFRFEIDGFTSGQTRVGTLPDSDGTFVYEDFTQTLTNKTLTSPVLTTPQINDTSADHQYIFGVSELVADRTVTWPLLTGNDTLVFEAHTATLTNKTVDLANNTLTGTLTQFNTAMSDGSFASLTGIETLTNKTLNSPILDQPQVNDLSNDNRFIFSGLVELTADRIVSLPLLTGNDTFVFEAHTATLTNKTVDLANNTLTGTLAEFNTAMSDGSFVSLAGTETLTNKTLTSPVLTTPEVTEALPRLYLKETGVSADEGNWSLEADGAILRLRTWDDALTSPANIFSVARSGTSVDDITVGAEFLLPDGSAGAPSYSFTSDATTGLFLTASSLHYAKGGVDYGEVITNKSQHIIVESGGSISTYDIGTTQATRKTAFESMITGLSNGDSVHLPANQEFVIDDQTISETDVKIFGNGAFLRNDSSASGAILLITGDRFYITNIRMENDGTTSSGRCIHVQSDDVMIDGFVCEGTTTSATTGNPVIFNGSNNSTLQNFWMDNTAGPIRTDGASTGIKILNGMMTNVDDNDHAIVIASTTPDSTFEINNVTIRSYGDDTDFGGINISPESLTGTQQLGFVILKNITFEETTALPNGKQIVIKTERTKRLVFDNIQIRSDFSGGGHRFIQIEHTPDLITNGLTYDYETIEFKNIHSQIAIRSVSNVIDPRIRKLSFTDCEFDGDLIDNATIPAAEKGNVTEFDAEEYLFDGCSFNSDSTGTFNFITSRRMRRKLRVHNCTFNGTGGGTYRVLDWEGKTDTCTFANAADEFTSTSAHQMAIGDVVHLSAGTPPTGYSNNKAYYVIAITPATNKFQLSETRGGPVVNGTDDGTGISWTTSVNLSDVEVANCILTNTTWHSDANVDALLDEKNASRFGEWQVTTTPTDPGDATYTVEEGQIVCDTTTGTPKWTWVGTDWQQIEKVYNVVAYGADPTGVAESHTAIQAAIDAADSAAEGEGIVFIPEGTYLINNGSTGITVPPGMVVMGAGIKKTILTIPNAVASQFHRIWHTNNPVLTDSHADWITFKDFSVHMNGPGQSDGDAHWTDQSAHGQQHAFFLTNTNDNQWPWRSRIRIQDVYVKEAAGDAFACRANVEVEIIDCYAEDINRGVVTVTGGNNKTTVRGVTGISNHPDYIFTASGITLTATGHTFSNDDKVKVTSTNTLPGGLSENTFYYVQNVSGDTLELSATHRGTSITTSDGGTGTHTIYLCTSDALIDMEMDGVGSDIRTAELYVYDTVLLGNGQWNLESMNNSICYLENCRSEGGNYTGIGPDDTEQVFTTNFAVDAEVFNDTAHGFSDGDIVKVVNSGGALPSPLNSTDQYILDKVDNDSYKLRLRPNGAYIQLTDNGSGTNSSKRHTNGSITIVDSWISNNSTQTLSVRRNKNFLAKDTTFAAYNNQGIAADHYILQIDHDGSEDQNIVFDSCKFKVEKEYLVDQDTEWTGVDIGNNATDSTNRVMFKNCEFDSTLDKAIDAREGSDLWIDGGDVDCVQFLRWEVSGTNDHNLYISNLALPPAVTTPFDFGGTGATSCTVTLSSVSMHTDVFTSDDQDYQNWNFEGGRTIFASAVPSTSTDSMFGDTLIVTNTNQRFIATTTDNDAASSNWVSGYFEAGSTLDTDVVLNKDDTQTAEFRFQVGGTDQASIRYDASEDMFFENSASNRDMGFRVNDGGVMKDIMFFDSNNFRVGFGTTTPSDTIEVEQAGSLSWRFDSNNNINIYIDSGSTTQKGQFEFQRAGVTDWFVGRSDANDAGDGDEFFIGTTTGGASPSLWFEKTSGVAIGTITTPSANGANTLSFNEKANHPTPGSNTATIYASDDGTGNAVPFAKDENNNRRPLVPYSTTVTLGAAATDITADSPMVIVNGDAGSNTVSTITGEMLYAGSRITLLFTDGNVTITDTDAHTSDTVDLSAAFTSADDTTLELISDGSSWYEVSRSAN